MEQHNIDSRFNEGLGNVSRQPSADAWARLQSQMAATNDIQVIVPEKEEEKRKPIFWLSIAAAVITLLVSVAVFRFASKELATSPELASNVVKDHKSETSTSEVKSDNLVEKTAVVQPENTHIARVSTSKSTEINSVPKQIEKQTTSVNTSNRKPETAAENQQLAAVKTSKVAPQSKLETKIKPEEKTESNETMLAVQTPAPKADKTANPEADLMGQPIEVIVKRDISANQVAMNEPEKSEENHKNKI